MKNNLLSKVFLWMFAGLMLTFITGYYVSCNEYTFYKIFSGSGYLIFALLEIGLVIFLSARVHKMQPNTAKIVFMLYSIISGITFSAIFMTYNISSIIILFLSASLLFGIFALLGYYTKIDLDKMSTYLFMGLIAVIICTIVNLFVGNSIFDIIISSISLLVFVVFTAYDVQKIKRLCDASVSDNIAIVGALELYLDFINIFIDLLNIFGGGKD